MFQFRLIDRYVFFLFFRVFLICFLSLTGIYIVGDFVNNLGEFIVMGNNDGGMLKSIISYYAVRAPWFFDLLGRINALIAAVFAITWLQRHNEMAALMAAGISRWRIIRPLFLGVAAISLLGVVNRELVLPKFRQQLSRHAKDLTGTSSVPITQRYDNATNILISGLGAFPKTKSIDQPKFHLPIDFAEFGRQIAADKAQYFEASKNRPAGFLLTNVTKPNSIQKLPSLQQNGEPVILTANDHKWLKPNQCFVVTNVTFGQLTQGRAWQQYSSTYDLVMAMRNPSFDLGNVVPVTVHARLVQPILDMTLFFLGVPIVLSRESRNVFIAVGSCLLVIQVFIALVMASHSLGVNYILNPIQAAWLPVGLLVPWAAYSADPLFR